MTRRQLFGLLGALGLARPAAAASEPSRPDRVVLSDDEWRRRLSRQA